MTASELIEQRASLVATARKMLDAAENEKRDTTSEENEQYDRLMGEVDTLTSKIDTASKRDRLAETETNLKRAMPRQTAPVGAVKEYNRKNEYRSALKNWLLGGTEYQDRSEYARSQGANHGLPLDARMLSFDLADALEARTMLQYGSPGTGKELAPQNLPDSFAANLKYIVPVLDYVSVITTADTRTIPYPTITDDTIGTIVPEAALIPDGDFNTGSVNLGAYKYSSRIQKVSIEFLNSAIGNVTGLVGRLLSDRIAKALNIHVFSDTDDGTKPQGLRAAAGAAAVVLGTRGNLTGDALLDLIYSVDQQYADNGTLVMNRSTVAAVRKLKDSQGRYLWQESFQQGEPANVMGYPVLVTPDMPSLSTVGANKVVLFGDLNNYTVRTAGPVQVMRSDERFMEYGLVAFSALQFLDGRYTGPANALKALGNPA